jgi:ABC-type branched-subunit amino acid transport system ATPase component
VSFRVSPGQIKGVIGPNGAGKTTLFNQLAGSLRPDAGAIHFAGENVTGWPPHRMAGLGLSRTFQQVRLFPDMTARENVMVGRHPRSRAGFLSALGCLPQTWREEREIRAAADIALARLSLSALAEHDAVSLPFGQQRYLELARALAAEPRMLLLDEPASGLNPHETAQLAETLKTIRDSGVTLLLVEHDMSLVMAICDEIVVLDHGRLIAEGTPAVIQRHPEVIRIYLGEEAADAAS